MLEELEWQLGGKVKSVLVIALAAALLTGQAWRLESRRTNWDNNPIDAYFASIEGEIAEDARERCRHIYLECWEEELSHAYAMMGEELPLSFFERGGYGEEAERKFKAFATAQGYLEGYYGSELQDTVDPLDACIELMRAQTLRIYGEVLAKQGEMTEREELFVFDGQEAWRMIENSKIHESN